jgi:hypothetical protein
VGGVLRDAPESAFHRDGNPRDASMSGGSKGRAELMFNTDSLTGKKERLAWLLRSDVPLTREDREFLAELYEGNISKPRGRPPRALDGEARRIRDGEDAAQSPGYRKAAVRVALANAAREVDRRKAELGERARKRGIAEGVLQEVAAEFHLGSRLEELRARMRLPLKRRYI